MPSINSVSFDTSKWEAIEQLDDRIIWKNDTADRLSLHFFPIPPDLPAPITNLTKLRNFYRQNVIQAGGGIISIDIVSVKNVSAIKTIFKFPMKSTGMRYIGSLTFPFANFSYVIKIDCPESGMTGVRDSLVHALVIKDFDPKDPFKGWFEDPYDKTRQDAVMWSKSDDEKYDSQFPDHPLSRARKYLTEIPTNLEFTNEVLRAKPF
ncbi:hypothetical protein [Aerosakkonema funiforme]|uniref:Uncharacterized protein n=1 Tax=Aerosakkonema funiforme FACHB-1375 TaxID=2949571 RepID=A0A926V994_9CYAN|nr:hypothetical protein [Aerosakkonema funiforme]MBD2179644.1 hypothetical protein [Aerosakkonema funiforme FACHB-1375]